MRNQVNPNPDYAMAHKKAAIKFFAGIALFALVLLLLYECPFKMITGMDCPGCGLTRAFGCIFVCDFSAAVKYHPMAPAIFIQLVYLLYYQFVLNKKLNQKVIVAGIFINALLMLAFWLYKIF